MYRFGSQQSPAANDVLVTGIGMVTPLAIGREESWSRLLNGDRAGRFVGEPELAQASRLQPLLKSLPKGAPVNHDGVSKSVSDRLTNASPHVADNYRQHFAHDCLNALVAHSVLEALEDAKLTVSRTPNHRVGCVIGTSKSSLRSMEQETAHLRGSAASVEHNWMNAFLPDAPLRTAQLLAQADGVFSCPVAACATGLISVIQAAQHIRSGVCDVCIAGSADASLRSSVIGSFHRLGVLSRFTDPASACRPFDKNRDGFIIGEGAAVFVLESRHHAERRQADSYGRILSGGWLTDPTGITQIDSEGHVVADLLKKLTATTSRPDYINLHGTATETNDQAEAAGVRRAFGPASPVCSALKGAIGHLLGAAGSVELAMTLLSLRDQVIPAAANHEASDQQCLIPLCTQSARSAHIESAMKLSLGFGGHVAGCLVTQ